MSRWNHTYFKAALADTQIDTDKGIIRDVVMCQVGEAKGHYVSLEQEFIDDLVNLANQIKSGSKARYGHPTMCSEALGTMLGRFKNVRVRGSQAIGDLHLSEFAAKSPEGDLKTYVLERAEEDPDSFGASIVFRRGESYQRDPETGEKVEIYLKDKKGRYVTDYRGAREFSEDYDPDLPVYATIKEYMGTDLVDQGAATDGLFSDPKLFASRISRFLDENPDIDQFLDSNPDVEEKAIQFLARRREFKVNKNMAPEETSNRLSKLEKKFESLKSIFSGGSKESSDTKEDSPTVESLTAELKLAKADINQYKKDLASAKLSAQEYATKLEEANKGISEIKKEFEAIKAENQKLGAKEEGEDAPGADANTPPPSSDSGEKPNPFSAIQKYAEAQHKKRTSLQA